MNLTERQILGGLKLNGYKSASQVTYYCLGPAKESSTLARGVLGEVLIISNINEIVVQAVRTAVLSVEYFNLVYEVDFA